MGAEAEVLKQALADAKASLQRGWAAWAAREAELVEARKEAAENARRAEEKAEALAAAQGALEMRGNELVRLGLGLGLANPNPNPNPNPNLTLTRARRAIGSARWRRRWRPWSRRRARST